MAYIIEASPRMAEKGLTGNDLPALLASDYQALCTDMDDTFCSPLTDVHAQIKKRMVADVQTYSPLKPLCFIELID